MFILQNISTRLNFLKIDIFFLYKKKILEKRILITKIN